MLHIQMSVESVPRMLVLVGLPGSGKSYIATRMCMDDTEWVRVSQEELGTRVECEKVASRELTSGRSVVIDRTNIDPLQRGGWLNIARQHRLKRVEVVELVVPKKVCKERVMARSGHPTLPAEPFSRVIIERFSKDYIPVGTDERFTHRHSLYYSECTDEMEQSISDFISYMID